MPRPRSAPNERDVPPTFPHLEESRRDLSVYYDGKGFYLTARRRADPRLDFRALGLTPEQAFAQHLALPVWMGNDCIECVRVVRGSPSPEEEQGWLARLVGRLRLDDGLLGICAELPVEVPPGDYLVEVGFHLPYALICDFFTLSKAKFTEPVGAWFRRTHPREPMPSWLTSWLTANPHDDPGHDAEWKKKRKSRAADRWVSLVVRLGDVSEPLSPTRIVRGMPRLEVRKPRICPTGIVAVDPFPMAD
jgi:hypothetical protein